MVPTIFFCSFYVEILRKRIDKNSKELKAAVKNLLNRQCQYDTHAFPTCVPHSSHIAPTSFPHGAHTRVTSNTIQIHTRPTWDVCTGGLANYLNWVWKLSLGKTSRQKCGNSVGNAYQLREPGIPRVASEVSHDFSQHSTFLIIIHQISSDLSWSLETAYWRLYFWSGSRVQY